MTERVVIPPPEQIEVTPRRFTRRLPGDYRPCEPAVDLIADMVRAGDGYRFHVTGMTHDERGYPNIGIDVHDRLVRRLLDKLKPLENGRGLCETEDLEDAEVVVVSYGITSRVAQHALLAARKRGVRVAKFRLITAWPFPAQRIRDLAAKVKAFVVPASTSARWSTVKLFRPGVAELQGRLE